MFLPYNPHYLTTLQRPAHRRYTPATVDPPTLFQFVMLSMLLHVLVILLFGSHQGAEGPAGEAWWGPLNVTLRRLTPEPGSGIRLAPGADQGAVNRSLLRRPEVKAEREPARDELTPQSPAEIERREITPPATSSPVEPLPRLKLEAPEETDKEVIQPQVPIERMTPRKLEREIAPPVELPPREVPMAPSVPIERIAPRTIEREVTAPVQLPPREVPVIPSATIERIAPPKIQQDVAPAVELPPREVPVAPSATIERIAPSKIQQEVAPAVELPPREMPVAPAATIERIAPSKIQQELAPAVELPPREVPLAPAATIERIAPSKIQQEVAPAVELPPREVLVAPAATIERIAPRTLERELALPAPSIAPPSPPIPGAGREAAPPASLQPRPALSAPTAVRPESQPQEALPRLRLGAPQPDESMFRARQDVVTQPSEPGGMPHIDRAASRDRAREIVSGRTGTRGVFNPLPVPPETKTKEALAIEKAVRPDCREAYAGLGLLAVPALVANAISDTGCKW